MTSRDKDQHFLAYAKFSNSLTPLNGKTSGEARLRLACFLIRNTVWHLMTDPATRAAIDTAERFLDGKADKKELLQARKAARQWLLRGGFQGYDFESKRAANFCAYSVTFWPMGRTSLFTVADQIKYALFNEHRAKDGDAVDYRVVDIKAYDTMTRLVSKFLGKPETQPKPIPSLLDDSQLKKYHVMYVNPYVMRDSVLNSLQDERAKKQVLAAIDSFFTVARSEESTFSDLRPILEVARSHARYNRERAVQLLLLLGMYHSAGQEALCELLRHPNADVRFTVVSHFGFYHLPYPSEFVLKLIETALQDRSAKVRLFAAQACAAYYKMRGTLPLLNAQLAKENNAKTRQSLEFNIAMVRDGYLVRPGARGSYWLTVRMDRGLSSTPIAPKDLEPKRLKRMVAAMQAEEVHGVIGVIGGGDNATVPPTA